MMYEKNEKKSISNLCAPTARPAPEQAQQQPSVWPLTQMGAGMAGKDARKLRQSRQLPFCVGCAARHRGAVPRSVCPASSWDSGTGSMHYKHRLRKPHARQAGSPELVEGGGSPQDREITA